MCYIISGSKKFFLGGDHATLLDCSAFAMLSQILWNMDNCAYRKAMIGKTYILHISVLHAPYKTSLTNSCVIPDSHENLCEFCQRIKTRYWPDWDQCLNNVVETSTSKETLST